jgi:malic enzyme
MTSFQTRDARHFPDQAADHVGRPRALAFSPGVAEACLAIVDDAANVSRFAARGTLSPAT